MEVQGRIKMVGETQSFGSNGFRKREIVITTEEQYPQHIMVEFVQDKTDLLSATAAVAALSAGAALASGDSAVASPDAGAALAPPGTAPTGSCILPKDASDSQGGLPVGGRAHTRLGGGNTVDSPRTPPAVPGPLALLLWGYTPRQRRRIAVGRRRGVAQWPDQCPSCAVPLSQGARAAVGCAFCVDPVNTGHPW